MVERLMPELLAGDHPALQLLREQWHRVRIFHFSLSGAGFFADFEVPTELAKTSPENFEGGDARLGLTGCKRGGGCILFVRDGHLSFLEGYTYDELWDETTEVTSIDNVVPIDPGASAA
jgi:hypothetical protein